MRTLGFLALVLLLAGCAGAGQEGVPQPKAPTTKAINLKPLCSQVKTYSDAESKALADAVVEIDPTSILIVAMADYARMRGEARACLANG